MKRLCFITLLLVLLAFPSNAHADVAPPYFPPGSNPQPGTDFTQVRMVAETVVIEVLKDTASRSLGRAHVTADFTMHNLGSAEESMAVRFPISANNGRGEYPEIGDLQILVNGAQVLYGRASYPDINYQDENVPWAEFDVAFPAGQDVAIRVAYDLQGSGYYPLTAFYYILETGAGWKDTIGSADVVLRLPYEANPQNIIMDLQVGWAETTPGGVFQGNEVRWHFDEFEPGQNQPVQNMEFVLISPSAWQAVLTAQANVVQHPKDSETWGMLAKAYKEVFLGHKETRSDDGGEELYQLSLEAYEKCLSLNPNDAQWHAGFAELLARRAFWESWITDVMSHPIPETFRALNEIHTALRLAPDDPVVQDIAWEISSLMPEAMSQNGNQYDFPWLTQTPTALPPTPTDVSAITPSAQEQTEVVSVDESTETALPAATNTPPVVSTQANPTPVPQRSSPICGSAAFLPLVAIFWFVRKRR